MKLNCIQKSDTIWGGSVNLITKKTILYFNPAKLFSVSILAKASASFFALFANTLVLS
jgi:hypothetical protein